MNINAIHTGDVWGIGGRYADAVTVFRPDAETSICHLTRDTLRSYDHIFPSNKQAERQTGTKTDTELPRPLVINSVNIKTVDYFTNDHK